MIVLKAIGKRIKLARIENDLNQEELGALIHVSGKTIAAWEAGRNEIGALSLRQLVDVLRKPISYFYEPFAAMAERPNVQAKRRQSKAA